MKMKHDKNQFTWDDDEEHWTNSQSANTQQHIQLLDEKFCLSPFDVEISWHLWLTLSWVVIDCRREWKINKENISYCNFHNE